MTTAGFTVSYLGTGSGGSTLRNHTAMVLECPGGERILLDAASGNTVLRHGEQLGIAPTDYDHCLLSHSHADHCEGLPHIEMQRSRRNPAEAPMGVYGSERAMSDLATLLAYPTRGLTVDADGVRRRDGRLVFTLQPTEPGEWVHLSPNVRARCAPVDHIGGAMAWRVESGARRGVFGRYPLVSVAGGTGRGRDVVDPRGPVRGVRAAPGRRDGPLDGGRGRAHRTAGRRASVDADAHRQRVPPGNRAIGSGSTVGVRRAGVRGV